ncbi:hypothetical protein OHA98_25315 [Streptomyces sp. NBC_00654]|uniref:hypothetical protein n=1 Tax=Streptomyces sp. NBC_00654 TaxID=2975799 RepID=UPI002254A7E6|nr:hypothetical protein [Streptomyces sp. NBC_00654]MCX4968020.1 hypothetical protein [Streptomyces sp. NBC_00654]
MHRTRITAKLLVGVAVTAVSGCVSVEPSADIPPRPGSSRPVQDVTPQIVQPPAAHEALESLESESLPDPKPSPVASAPPSASAHRAPAAVRRPAPLTPRLREAVESPKRWIPGRLPRVPPPGARAVPRSPGGTPSDVCALGRGYGGWPAGSPQSRICEQTYGD